MKSIHFNSIKQKPKGFTLTELMVALSLFFLLAGIGMGAYFEYYSFSLINNDVSNVQELIRNTRFKALKNPDSSNYGLHINASNNEITSFKENYNANENSNISLKLEQLSITDLSLMPIIGTSNEIIFEAVTGKTQNTGNFSVGNGNFEYTFSINAQGAID